MTELSDREKRFWSFVDPNGQGCWLWHGRRGRATYGAFYFGGVSTPAHRVTFEMAFGPIPEGLQIDHLCRTPACVNPYHLDAVTRRENILRGIGKSAENARKTHCPKGHPYSGENLRVRKTKRGRRACRTCENTNRNANRAAKRAAAIRGQQCG